MAVFESVNNDYIIGCVVYGHSSPQAFLEPNIRLDCLFLGTGMGVHT